MSVGASTATAAGLLSAVFQGTPFSFSSLYAQLHVGDPGAAGTANIATMSTRVDVSACFASSPTDGGTAMQIVNSADMGPFGPATAAETPTHITFWSAITGGIFAGSGYITGSAVAIGDSFTVPAGDCTAQMPHAT